ncbi:hypothetical protein H4219_000602 [Mycoemilia scoparia]|uniref:Uncharacterized protein n=1 Tax=Mycoemilia scoparia TaxID=417184 RepID=A0A9W8ABN2_9FUNG|nr:hypothetical protein H4219_000602 [Mycoemilia scoparia]
MITRNSLKITSDPKQRRRASDAIALDTNVNTPIASNISKIGFTKDDTDTSLNSAIRRESLAPKTISVTKEDDQDNDSNSDIISARKEIENLTQYLNNLSFKLDSKVPIKSSLKYNNTKSQRSKNNDMTVCRKLYQPWDNNEVPKINDLRLLLKGPLSMRIPIRKRVYDTLLENMDRELVNQDYISLEESEDFCPQLSIHIENALMIQAVEEGTEAMCQTYIDAFLYAIFGTAKNHAFYPLRFDRNKNDLSMTLPGMRPDFVCWYNHLLVFKGEEKKKGDVRIIAKELVDKMAPDVLSPVGLKTQVKSADRNHTRPLRPPYLLAYSSAGTRVLFVAIDHNNKLVECSNVLDISRLHDRFLMVRYLVNTVRAVSTIVKYVSEP